jgi:hypothetical protein
MKVVEITDIDKAIQEAKEHFANLLKKEKK